MEIMKMEVCRVYQILTLLLILVLFPGTYAWGTKGHFTVCKIAQSRLSKAAEVAGKKLLPQSANNDLANVCSWAEAVNFRYRWSSALHFVNTPDKLCTYQCNRDCKDEDGVEGRCAAGAINNYSTQLLTYNDASSKSTLHVGFTSDKGGNTIDVQWYTRKQNLHHVRLLVKVLTSRNRLNHKGSKEKT